MTSCTTSGIGIRISLSISFDELQDAFADLHKESIKLAKLVSSSKKTVSDLENEISKLNNELDHLKTEVSISKSNEKVYISTISDKKISDSCNCCSKYEKEIKDLKNSLAKFSISKNNLDVILGKQRCVSNKAGIGYKPEKQQKFHKNLFTSTQKFTLVFTVEEKGMAHLLVILRKTTTTLK